MDSTEVWIGLLEVRELNSSGALGGDSGAFCNVLALAKDFESFEAVVQAHALDYELEILRLSDAEPLWKRASSYKISNAILLLGQEVQRSRKPAFTEFHSFDE